MESLRHNELYSIVRLSAGPSAMPTLQAKICRADRGEAYPQMQGDCAQGHKIEGWWW